MTLRFIGYYFRFFLNRYVNIYDLEFIVVCLYFKINISDAKSLSICFCMAQNATYRSSKNLKYIFKNQYTKVYKDEYFWINCFELKRPCELKFTKINAIELASGWWFNLFLQS